MELLNESPGFAETTLRNDVEVKHNKKIFGDQF